MKSVASLLVLLGASCIVAQSPPSNLPPTEPGIFTAQASVTVDAPIQEVWAILLDFQAYPQWNPFVRSQTVTNALGVPLSDQTPHENLRLIIQAQIPPLPTPVDENTPPNLLNAQLSFENITTIDEANHRASWRAIMLPPAILDAERWQALSTVDGDKTFYEAREVFRGPVGYIVDALYGEGVQEGFAAQAAALKARAERK